MPKEFTLTTIDNPYNPFTQFNDWFSFDSDLGYDTCSLLANFSRTSYDLDDEDNEEELNRAMDEIVDLFDGKLYKKVCREDYQ